MVCAWPVDATITNLVSNYLISNPTTFRVSPMGGSKITGAYFSVDTSMPLVITPAGTTFYGSPKIAAYVNVNNNAYSTWSLNADGSWPGGNASMTNGTGATQYGSTPQTAGWNVSAAQMVGQPTVRMTGIVTSGPAVSLCLASPPSYGTTTVSGSVQLQYDYVLGYTTVATDYNYAINNHLWTPLTIPVTFSYTRSASVSAMSFSPNTLNYTTSLNTAYQAATDLTITGDYPGTLGVSWTATTDRGFTVSSVDINGTLVNRSGDTVTFSGMSGVQTTTTHVLINVPGMSQPGTYTTNLNFTVSLP